jgi:hypothetical protein
MMFIGSIPGGNAHNFEKSNAQFKRSGYLARDSETDASEGEEV